MATEEVAIRLPCGHMYTRSELLAYISASCGPDRDDSTRTGDCGESTSQTSRESARVTTRKLAHGLSRYISAFATSATIVAPPTIAFVIMGSATLAMLSA
jgi:hypothetical protein